MEAPSVKRVRTGWSSGGVWTGNFGEEPAWTAPAWTEGGVARIDKRQAGLDHIGVDVQMNCLSHNHGGWSGRWMLAGPGGCLGAWVVSLSEVHTRPRRQPEVVTVKGEIRASCS